MKRRTFATNATRLVGDYLAMRIVADIHERASGVPRLLADDGVTVEVKSLRAGDYAVGGSALVERKTVRGLHAAIIDGTFCGFPAAEAALACVPGISTVLAGALLAQFGTLRAVVAADPAEWRRVTGIGPTKAAALAATVRAPHPASHSPRRGEWRGPQRPST